MVSMKNILSMGAASAALGLATLSGAAAAQGLPGGAIGDAAQDVLVEAAVDAAEDAARDAAVDAITGGTGVPTTAIPASTAIDHTIGAPLVGSDITTAPISTGVSADPIGAERVISARRPATARVIDTRDLPVVVPAQQQYLVPVQQVPVQQVATRQVIDSQSGQPVFTQVAPNAGQLQNGQLPNGAQLVSFDRTAWLAECSARLNSYEENDRGRVIGALLGAAGGGLLGNRLDNGNRRGGTLLGAGVGALAGALAGDGLDDRADFNERALANQTANEQCTAYLDDYMQRASQSAPTTNYAPGQQYMLVPVTVPVAQQAVIREVPSN
jgi:outer membrane lipoprotein SlyB